MHIHFLIENLVLSHILANDEVNGKIVYPWKQIDQFILERYFRSFEVFLGKIRHGDFGYEKYDRLTWMKNYILKNCNEKRPDRKQLAKGRWRGANNACVFFSSDHRAGFAKTNKTITLRGLSCKTVHFI